VRVRTAAWLGWAIWTGALVLALLAWLFELWGRPPLGSILDQPFWLFLAGTALLFCAPGALVVAHKPANPVGWILCTIGLSAGVAGAARGYGDWATSGPARVFALWIADVLSAPIVGLVPLLLLLFPTGRPLSRRWRPVVWLMVIATAGLLLTAAFSPGPLGGQPGNPPNPLAIAVGASWLWDVHFLSMLLLLAVAALLSLLAVFVRYRQARGGERQQLKWLLYGGAVLTAALLVALSGMWFNLVAPALLGFAAFTSGMWFNLVAPALLGFAAFTSCVAVAMLRHHLYDIDRLVSRTVAYGLLTAVLGLAYLAGVLLLRQVLDPLTGSSSLAVAASTLAVAALFRPAQHRIQDAVDQRFNRHRYNAAKTIEEFSAHLRHEVDLDTLSAELVAVVDQTMQPTSASLWLRPSARPLASGRGQAG
jgi:hypothetical protein